MKWIKILPLIIICLQIIPETKAQEIFLPGSRSQALAGASAGLNDCWSVFGNQAGISGLRRIEAGGSFQNKFLIKELSIQSGFILIPVQNSVFALTIYQFGKSYFRNEKFGLAFAHALGTRLSFGLQFNYYRYYLAEENESNGSFGAELGFHYQLSESLLLGIHATNPFQSGITGYSGKYNYPTLIRIGGFHQISQEFGWLGEIEFDPKNPLKIRTGIEYNLLKSIFIRAGIGGKPYQLSGGMGIALKKLKADFAFSYNQYLGNSPSVSFQYQF
jgi:hypothetical protein